MTGKYLKVALKPTISDVSRTPMKIPGEFYIGEDICCKGAGVIADYIENHVIPALKSDPGKNVFIVSLPYQWGGCPRGVIDEEDGFFFKEELGGCCSCSLEPKEYEIRELVLSEDGELLCTEPYTRGFNDLVNDWPENGLGALKSDSPSKH